MLEMESAVVQLGQSKVRQELKKILKDDTTVLKFIENLNLAAKVIEKLPLNEKISVVSVFTGKCEKEYDHEFTIITNILAIRIVEFIQHNGGGPELCDVMADAIKGAVNANMEVYKEEKFKGKTH